MLGKIAQNLEGLSPQRKLDCTPHENAANGIEGESIEAQHRGRRSKHLMPLPFPPASNVSGQFSKFRNPSQAPLERLC